MRTEPYIPYHFGLEDRTLLTRKISNIPGFADQTKGISSLVASQSPIVPANGV